MAYTTPQKVFQTMNRLEAAEETLSSVSGGDTVTLSNYYIIKNTETITLDGSSVADSDYSIDFDDNTVTYTGTGSGELKVDYSYGPYSSSIVEDKIAGVEQYIDDYTNSTYDGQAQVTDEYYDGAGRHENVYTFVRRPVRSVSEVSVNTAGSGDSNPSYEVVSEGLGDDYVKYQDLGIKFMDNSTQPNGEPRDLKVSYEYGYSDVPSDLATAAAEMVVDDLTRGTVSGAMVDGRDNFDPQTVNVQKEEYMTVLDRYRIERYENVNYLAEKGSIS